METNELVKVIEYRVERIKAAEETGFEGNVRTTIDELRDILNLAHAEQLAADEGLEEKLDSSVG